MIRAALVLLFLALHVPPASIFGVAFARLTGSRPGSGPGGHGELQLRGRERLAAEVRGRIAEALAGEEATTVESRR